MIVIEATAAIDSAGTLHTFYVSDEAFVTKATDTPTHTAFDPRLIDPGTLGISAFSNGTTGGASRLEKGEIIIANPDGALDAWINYSFDGRPVVIRSGSAGDAYPSGFTTLFTGTIASVDADWQRIILVITDKQLTFERPCLTNTYLGNNSLPNGLEGVAGDLKGQVKPKAYGKVFNVSPPFVNTSKLTYQVSDGAVADIPAVYDGGVSLTKGSDYATSALMQAATPAAGTYITCFAEGYFRLCSNPAYQITADVVQGAAASNRTVAQILKQLALDAGISSGDISSADVTALDTAAPQEVGVWVSDTSSFLMVMDEIAASVGAFYGFDGVGTLRMGQLQAPSGSPVLTIYDYSAADTITRHSPKSPAIPIWRCKLGHTKIYTTQQSGLAGSVTTVFRSFLASEYRNETADDASIKTQWMLSEALEQNTLLTSGSDAATEASRRLALHKVRRDVYEVTLHIALINLKMLDAVTLVLPRFGMDSGKLLRVIGMDYQLSKSQVTLTLWG